MGKKLIKEMLNDSFWIMPATPDFINEGVPYITSKNIKKGQILMESAKYISEEDYNRIARNRPIETNDILISMIGTLGEAAIVKSEYGDFYGQNVYLLRLNDKKINHKYFLYFMKSSTAKRHFESKMNQSTQKYLKADHIESLEIPDISLNEQIEAAKILDKLNSIIIYREEQLNELDNLIKSRFVEMFGDPISNTMGWDKRPLADECKIVTGNTPSRKVSKYYGDFIEWIKSDNINTPSATLTTATEYLSEEGVCVGRTVDAGAILMTCIAGSIGCIGNVAIADRKVSFNQQINGIVPGYNDTWFMYVLFELSKKDIQSSINMSLKGILSKGQLSEMKFIFPPTERQKEFGEFVQQVDKLKIEVQKSLDETQLLFDSLMQKYFK